MGSEDQTHFFMLMQQPHQLSHISVQIYGFYLLDKSFKFVCKECLITVVFTKLLERWLSFFSRPGTGLDASEAEFFSGSASLYLQRVGY